MQGQDGLAVFGKEHEIGFPMAWNGAILGLGGPFGDRHAMLDMQGGTATPPATPATFCLGARQVVTPGIIFVAGEPGGGEGVDGLPGGEAPAISSPQENASLPPGPALAPTSSKPLPP